MENFDKMPIDIPKERIDSLINNLVNKDFHLHQETEDKYQLNPTERLKSIDMVYQTIKDKLGNPQTALDVGSGFGFGIVYLQMNNIQTIGIENVHIKNEQAINMFGSIGVKITNADENTLDFSKTPAICETNFSSLKKDSLTKKLDLITMFFVSGQMFAQPQICENCKSLIGENGKILVTSEVTRSEAEDFLKKYSFWVDYFDCEIIDIPNNFEKIAMILSLKNQNLS